MRISCHRWRMRQHTRCPCGRWVFQLASLHLAHIPAPCRKRLQSAECPRDENKSNRSYINPRRLSLLDHWSCIKINWKRRRDNRLDWFRTHPVCSLSSFSSWIFSTHFGIARMAYETSYTTYTINENNYGHNLRTKLISFHRTRVSK